jgi:hypothetical protein
MRCYGSLEHSGSNHLFFLDYSYPITKQLYPIVPSNSNDQKLFRYVNQRKLNPLFFVWNGLDRWMRHTKS